MISLIAYANIVKMLSSPLAGVEDSGMCHSVTCDFSPGSWDLIHVSSIATVLDENSFPSSWKRESRSMAKFRRRSACSDIRLWVTQLAATFLIPRRSQIMTCPDAALMQTSLLIRHISVYDPISVHHLSFNIDFVSHNLRSATPMPHL